MNRTPAIARTLITLTTIVVCYCFIAPITSAVPPEFRRAVEMEPVYEQFPDLGELVLSQGVIVWPEQDEAATEPNNEVAEAFTVPGNVRISGHADEITDHNDFFKVVLTEPASIFVSLEWSGSAWLNVYIYDAQVQPVTYLNENTPSPKKLCKWQYDGGTFYVRVRIPAGASDYYLTIGVAGQLAEPQNDALDTTDLEISRRAEPVTSVVCSSADPVDYFVLVLPIGNELSGVYLDWFGGRDANLDFEIYDSEGELLITMAESSMFESIVSQNVPMGTYYIAVKAVNGRAMYKLTADANVLFRLEMTVYLGGVWGPILY